jgi:prepilin-type N-terminal cleavage/methylation domain-containing protein
MTTCMRTSSPVPIRTATYTLLQRPSDAFTLVELLVVIAIIGILVGLLLPAVQAARESARKSQCLNQLKQLGLAMHNYEATFERLPPGYVYEPGSDGNSLGHGWGAFVLPFIEEQAIFDAIDFDLPVFHSKNQSTRETHLATFLCPTDTISPSGFIVMGNERWAMGCYVANFGPPDLDENQEQRDGVFSRNSQTRLSQIIDGLSKTLMIGERQNGPFRGGVELNNHFEYETTWAASVRDIDDATDDHGHMTLFQTGHTPNDALSDDRDVSASHEGLAQFLRCDGSVEPVAEDVDFALYNAMGTRAGGEAIDSL